MEKYNIPEMWDYLTDMEKYNQSLPIYVDSPFSAEQVEELESIIEEKLSVSAEQFLMPGGQEEYRGKDWFDPKKVTHMSREMVEFIAPWSIEQVMNKHVFGLHQDDIRLCHYSYIDYDPKHGDGRYAPSLPPHIDNTETIVTFNYMLDGNVDWEIYVDEKPYSLKKGDALMFSAVNQPHFRPKRKWKKGEFVKIVTFDYSPLTDWRFQKKDYPLDPEKFQDRVQEYLELVNKHPKMQSSWNLYNKLGKDAGIPDNVHGLLLESDEV
jgi:hypothetical protein